jgi:small nuclear ribonucleoprotein (snRNP)-like protein
MQDTSMLERNLAVIERYIGKILVCKLRTGRVFSAKLVSVHPNGMLLFENSRNQLMSDSILDIVEISEYRPRVPRSTNIDEV